MGTNVGGNQTVSGNLTVDGDIISDGGISTQSTIIAQGNMYAPDFVQTSDYRVKNFIKQILPDEALKAILNLNPITFEYKNIPGIFHDGFFAHEVQNQIENAVHGNKDEYYQGQQPKYQHLSYLMLIPWLVGAIQKQQEIIQKLEDKLNKSNKLAEVSV